MRAGFERRGPLVLGALSPRMGRLTLEEAQELLYGLHRVNLLQLRQGVPPISLALRSRNGWRRLRYIRADPREEWRDLRTIWLKGGGDCEDLAAAVSAEYEFRTGFRARPIIKRIRPGLAHALVEILEGPDAGKIIDPSRTGGMGEP